VTDRQGSELFDPADEENIRANHEPPCSQLDQASKSGAEIAFGAGMQDVELEPQCAGNRLQVSQ
jgi:hypothetical protein